MSHFGTAGFLETLGDRENVRFMHIHASLRKADNAFLSIRYRNNWFWIDDRDLNLFSLAETGVKQSLPLITIPAQ